MADATQPLNLLDRSLELLKAFGAVGAAAVFLLETVRRWRNAYRTRRDRMLIELTKAREELCTHMAELKGEIGGTRQVLAESIGEVSEKLSEHAAQDMTALDGIDRRITGLGREVSGRLEDHAERLRWLEQFHHRGDKERGR